MSRFNAKLKIADDAPQNVQTVTYDANCGSGFPYSIPRNASNTNLWKTKEKQIVSEDKSCTMDYASVNKETKLNQEMGTQNISESIQTIPSFSYKPPISTGRVIYSGFPYSRTGYGLGTDVTIDTTTLTSKEARIIKRKLRDWAVETQYYPTAAESARFASLWKSRILGFMMGSGMAYFAVPYIKSVKFPNPIFQIIFAISSGVLGGTVAGRCAVRSVYINILQLNTPMGFKCRQFLHESREHDQLNATVTSVS